MYDVVVVGQGLTGLLSAIWAKERGNHVALVSQGTGKILQSTGLIDGSPGMGEKENTMAAERAAVAASEKFKTLMNNLGYPYHGQLNKPAPIVTGSGYVKWTSLYPETITPVPEEGNVVIAGFQEIVDFKAVYVKENLQKERPKLNIEAVTVRLKKHSSRTMTQLDAARVLEQKEARLNVIGQMRNEMTKQNISHPRLIVFPAALGVNRWKSIVREFEESLDAAVTEAPGMPPNASAVRFYEALKKGAIRLGVRFYMDTQVLGCHVEENLVKSLKIKTTNRTTEISGLNYIIASGGILGGGVEVTSAGLKDRVLGLEVDEFGQYTNCPHNVFPVGASQGTKVTRYGITGGMFSILSSYEANSRLNRLAKEDKHA
ncbi:FAD-binding protein [Thermoactinomyces mirandus]|uniref:FAD-binding protein n=1 Tax=Thermoactinomyces mirandus TaxID=2756294 RepID=A0A7W1XV52_9BACL|nr:FAD-binding protein [Thermoactinomyces mirandus]MBA4603854.1 FAD-binding protein [Thermoactinomyces mirandus]